MLERARAAARIAQLMVQLETLPQQRLCARKLLLLYCQTAQLRQCEGRAALVAHLASDEQALLEARPRNGQVSLRARHVPETVQRGDHTRAILQLAAQCEGLLVIRPRGKVRLITRKRAQ